MTLIPQFEEIPAGTTTRTNPFVQYFTVKDSTTILRGSVCSPDVATGFFNATAGETKQPRYVAIQTIVAGASNTLRIGVVGSGEWVTVVAGGAINEGDYVKIGTAGTSSVITKVTRWIPGTDADGLKVGRFTAKPSGNVVRDDTTPFNETYQDVGDYNVTAAVDTEIIEIRVGNN